MTRNFHLMVTPSCSQSLLEKEESVSLSGFRVQVMLDIVHFLLRFNVTCGALRPYVHWCFNTLCLCLILTQEISLISSKVIRFATF